MSHLDGPEFEGIFLPDGQRPAMARPGRTLPSAKLVHQIWTECDLDDDTAERVANWAADWADLRDAATRAKPFVFHGGVEPATAYADAARLAALLAERDALVVIAEAARAYVRVGHAMGDCSGNILPLLKAQSAAFDALVAAVEAEGAS